MKYVTKQCMWPITGFYCTACLDMMLFLYGNDKKEVMERFDRLDNAIGYARKSCPSSKSAVAPPPVSLRSDVNDIKDTLNESAHILSDMRDTLRKMRDSGELESFLSRQN